MSNLIENYLYKLQEAQNSSAPVKVNNNKIVQLAVSRIKRKGIDITKDSEGYSRLKKGITITTKQYMQKSKKKPNVQWRLRLPFLTRGPNGPFHFTLTLSRAKLSNM
jgi:hypothetical protein